MLRIIKVLTLMVWVVACMAYNTSPVVGVYLAPDHSGDQPSLDSEPINVTTSEELIEAIIQANDESLRPGPDRIVLQPGTYELTQPFSPINEDGPTGLPSIESVIEIDGQGQTITRYEFGPVFRIFHISLTGDLTLRDVTISQGTVITASTEARCVQ
jgi:hypothetical protein